MNREYNIITFHWLKNLVGKRIRVNNDIEGYYMGGEYRCCTKGKIRVKVNDIWVTLAGREKNQIEILN